MKSNKLPNKKIFLEAIDRYDVISIFEYLSLEENKGTKPINELGKAKLQELWQCICDVLLTLPPSNKTFTGKTKDVETPDGNKTENTTDSPSSEEQGPRALPDDVNERTDVAMALLLRVFPCITSKHREPSNLEAIAKVLNFIVESDKYCSEITNIAEMMWRKKWSGREALVAKPLKTALQKILSGSATRADVRRFLVFKDAVTPNFKIFNDIKPLLMKCISNKTFLAEQTSLSFLATLFTFDIDILKLCHGRVKAALVEEGATKTQARCYGRIYGLACQQASCDEVRVYLNQECLQFFIISFIRAQWNIQKQTMKPLGHLLKELLKELNATAKKNVTSLRILYDSYEPILWRHLVNSNSCFRTNASFLLLNLYPIEKPWGFKPENERLLTVQYKAILGMLEDPSHLVRLLAVQEGCRIYTFYWNCLPQFFRKQALIILINKLAFDLSYFEIRKSTLLGLTFALKHGSYTMAAFVGQQLRHLKPLLFDQNKNVSRAMLTLLLAVQNIMHPNGLLNAGMKVPQCWDIVSPAHIFQLLASEDSNSPAILPMVNLLLPSMHPKDLERRKQISEVKRVSWFVKQNLQAARNFYENSVTVIPMINAVKLMQKIMTVLNAFYKKNKQRVALQKKAIVSRKRKLSVEDKENTNQENCADDSQSSNPEASSSQEPNESLEESDPSSFESSKSPDDTSAFSGVSLSDPAVVRGLLEVVFILWLLHERELHLPENAKYNKKLALTAKDTTMQLYKHWKDDAQVIHPLLLIASMLPKNRVRHLVSYSISHLRTLMEQEEEVPTPLADLFLTALCNWNCGDQIIELIGEGLSVAIQSAISKNKTLAPKKSPPPKKRRVAFEDTKVLNPKVALEYMHLLLVNPINHEHIMQKSHVAVSELLVSLQPIQNLAEYRLQRGKFCDMISDYSIHLHFHRYIHLIALMRSLPDHPYDVTEKYEELILWSQNSLIPYTDNTNLEPEELITNVNELPIVALLLNDIFKGASLAIHSTHVSNSMCQQLLKLCHLCIDSAACQYLLPGILCVSSAIAYHLVCVEQGKREDVLTDIDLESDITDLINQVLRLCKDGEKIHTALKEDESEHKFDSNIEEMIVAYIIHNQGMATLCTSFLQAVLQITEFNIDEDSEDVSVDLSYSASYFLSLLLGSPISSDLIINELEGLIFEFGERSSGLEAITALVNTFEQSKWRRAFSSEQRNKLKLSLDCVVAASLDKTMAMEVTQDAPQQDTQSSDIEMTS